MPPRFLALALAFLPVAAHAVTLRPVTLPAAEPTSSSLLAVPADIPVLQGRRTLVPWKPHFDAVRSFVDGRLGSLDSNAAGLGDDVLSKVAKGAGLLHLLGETPPNTFVSYSAVVARAVKAVKSRSPGSPLFPPSDAIDVLQDSSRLQSLVEGYDFVRGAVPAGDDTAMRNVIADWAEALRNDLNLTGALGIAGHRDNWGIKAGAVLVECALALPRHANAAQWLSFGRTLLDESLAKVSDAQGWFRESPHYLNYSLANLFTAAVAVQSRTGVDWFEDLAPFARLALDMRQPDGWSAPFEEGVSTTFPYDVFAGRMTSIAPQLAWAWSNSPKDASNFENQAFHSVTRFLFVSDAAPQEPPAPAARFADGPAHVHVLRSGWGADATQLTAVTAQDHASTTTVSSRHNMQNPLDFTLYGQGRMLVATSGGGPTVTSSANRAEYLKASSRNVPLLGGNAPFVTDPSKVRSDGRLDSAWADAARTEVTAYPNATVRRTWLLLDDDAVFVADDMQATGTVDVALPFHPRGTRAVRSAGPGPVDATWTIGDAALDLFAVANPPATGVNTGSFSSPRWNVEESIQGLDLRARTGRLVSIARLDGRAGAASAAVVESLQATSGAGLRVTKTDGDDRVVVGSFASEDLSAEGALVVVRRSGGALRGLVAVAATSVTLGGVRILEAASPVTFAATFAEDGLVLVSTRDAAPGQSFTLRGVLHPGGWAKSSEGGRFVQSGDALGFSGIPAGSTTTLVRGGPPSITAEAEVSVREGEVVRVTPVVSDPDGADSVTLHVADLPPGAGFDELTGTLEWTPGFDVSTRASGSVVPVTFTVSDGFHDAGATTRITVLDVNRRPTLAPASSVTVVRGEEAVVDLFAADPDGDALSFAVRAAAEMEPVPAVSGEPPVLRWTPGDGVPVGTWAAEVEVSDGLLTSVATIAFVVRAPVVDAGPGEPDAGAGSVADAGDGGDEPAGCGCGTSGFAPGVFVVLLWRRSTRRTGPRAA